MKLPSIPLPESRFRITVRRGGAKRRRATMISLLFLLWLTPAGAVEYVMTSVYGGHSPWTLPAAYTVFAISVLLVGVRDGGGEEQK